MAKKNIYSLKTVDGNPVRVEEAWKDANGEPLTEKVNKADAQTITGLKTFATLPQSSATPSNDSDLATKKYSDDLWATRKAQEEKCYQALKTVTKDFTRTDPVYVRIGEDGEPEIHYTMTQANGARYFAGMDLGDATLHAHNFAKVTALDQCFEACKCARVTIDGVNDSVTMLYRLFSSNGARHVSAFALPAKATSIYAMFYGNKIIEEIPAIDLSNITLTSYDFEFCASVTSFKAYGMKTSFSLSDTGLKHDAILEVFNNLGTVTAGSGVTLTIGDEKKALMTTEEIKIATDKGWEVA